MLIIEKNKNKLANMIYGVDIEKLIFINNDKNDLRICNIIINN